MSRRVEVVDYRPEWEKEYKEESKKIKQALGKNCVSIEHIGSTAVKGMKAKPVIDIMPVVKKLSAVDAVHEELELPADDSSSKAGKIQHFMCIFLKNGIKMKSEDIWQSGNI